ncbi:hypothetical protein [Natribacillus halophilus]|uniref:Uncharacterized protein n=1 Tax=Natribacillus halophilus TaxID=549003 RepID=A0A1G8RTG7_9BACI|nr:hypothetical protein [Natribacillus halophilus]SDJ20223.1 hypothetical protein SAMN04488123_12038 [Natribacillus halophilus]
MRKEKYMWRVFVSNSVGEINVVTDNNDISEVVSFLIDNELEQTRSIVYEGVVYERMKQIVERV